MFVLIRNILAFAACCGIGCALAAGAYTDWKTRTIPNWIPLTILICGCFTATSWVTKISNIIIICILLWLLSVLMKQKSGGGDIKLYMALTFALGLQSLAVILVLALIICKLHQMARKDKLEKGERIPLCCYVFPAYVIDFTVMTLTMIFH